LPHRQSCFLPQARPFITLLRSGWRRCWVDHSCFDHVFFANSGAEANEGAIKLARKYGALHRNGAHEIITFEGGFSWPDAGNHVGIRQKAFEPLFEPKVAGFPKARPERYRGR